MDNKIEYSKPVPPFVKFCAANIPVVFDDSLSYYEALCALWKWMQDNLVDVINNNAAVTDYYIEYDKETRALFIQLKEYVDTYFDNLDVQEEINNKLDEMAEDGTLQAMIDNVFENVEYIFPKNYVNDSNTQFGDICIIKAYGKVILIDSASYVYKDEVYEFLERNGVEHIDHMIISHYHADHHGNVVNFITDGYIDSNSKVYLAPYCNLLINFSQGMATYNEIITACQNNNIPYVQPTEGYTLTLDDDFKIKFYNFDITYLDDTTKLTLRDYNNASAINIIEHKNKKLLFTGDCYEEPIEHLMDNGTIENAFDFVKISHHGIDNGTLNVLLYPKLAPEYAFLPANTGYLINNDLVRSKYVRLYLDLGTRIFAQYISDVDCHFETGYDEIKSLSGNVLKAGSKIPLDQTVYVDINTDCVDPDGSQEKPFKDLGQAIISIPKGVGRTTIRLADGTYNTAHAGTSAANLLTFEGVNVAIYGHAGNRDAVHLKNGFNCVNSTVYLENITIDVTSQKTVGAINADSSNVNLKWVDFKGDTTSATKYHAIRAMYSTINLISVVFNYVNRAIYADFSNILSQESTFTDCTYGAYVPTGTIYMDKTSYNSGTPVFANNVMHLTVKPKVLLGSSEGGDVTFNDDLTRYNRLIVQTGSTSSATYYTDCIYAYRDLVFAKNRTYKARTLNGMVTILIDASDGTKANITCSEPSETIVGIIGEIVPTEGL